MIINTNINAMKTDGSLKRVNEKNAKILERLSSGLKINRAADDSAGLAISEKMRSQVRGLNQASRNLQDGISFVQTADGALSSVHDILQRARELCVQAANDTNTVEDRRQINKELQQLNVQIDKIGDDTEFNTLKVFMEGVSADDKELFRMIAQVWVASALDQIQKTFNTFDTAGDGKPLTIVFANMGGGTMASMSATGSSSPTEFTLRINVNYFDALLRNRENYSGGGTATTGYELYDKIIAHEMMHGVMFDTMWTEIVGQGASIPSWFMEGTAEAVGGGFYRIAPIDNDKIMAGLNKGGSFDYSSGYAACMYLGYLAGGSNMDNVSIANGLDKIFAELAAGQSFSDVLKNTANINMTESEFITHFQTNPNVDAFLTTLKNTVGSGSGSVVASLNASPADTIPEKPDSETNPYDANISSKYFIVTNQLQAIDATLIVQVGANSNQHMKVNRFGLSADALGLPSASTLGTQQSYNSAIASYDSAYNTVSYMRGYYGAIQNRMEYCILNTDNYAENAQAAESRIRDADMSLLMLDFTKTNIISQAATSMLAQANQIPQNILTLLR